MRTLEKKVKAGCSMHTQYNYRSRTPEVSLTDSIGGVLGVWNANKCAQAFANAERDLTIQPNGVPQAAMPYLDAWLRIPGNSMKVTKRGNGIECLLRSDQLTRTLYGTDLPTLMGVVEDTVKQIVEPSRFEGALLAR